MIVNYIEIEQPIGTFYMCCIRADMLLNIVEVTPRSKNIEGVQRDMSKNRIKDIANYCSDPDAVFPTPIVVSINPEARVVIDEQNKTFEFNENLKIGEVIDGQHRLWGIGLSNRLTLFNLPVVFVFDLTVEERAYIFSTINSNQRRVDPSLIYDLFELSDKRSPYKTVHEIARVMNFSENSPFYNRLKMLGKKNSDQSKATLSQGSFVKYILTLISKDPDDDARNIKLGRALVKNPKYCLRQYFIDSKDEVITKIMMNCFNALSVVFRNEWDNPENNILWKTTGFAGVIYAFPNLYKLGQEKKNLTQDFFEECFKKFKAQLEEDSLDLTSRSFPGGGGQNQTKLGRIILKANGLS